MHLGEVYYYKCAYFSKKISRICLLTIRFFSDFPYFTSERSEANEPSRKCLDFNKLKIGNELMGDGRQNLNTEKYSINKDACRVGKSDPEASFGCIDTGGRLS